MVSSRSWTLGLFAILMLLSLSAFGQSQDDIESAQVVYAEARIQENRGLHAEALITAQHALSLNKNNADAAELVMQIADRLGEFDLASQQRNNLDRIHADEAAQAVLDAQLAIANERMEQGNCSDALTVLEKMTSAYQGRGAANDLQAQDVYFRMAVCHMNLGENGKFEKEMHLAGRDFYQRTQFLKGEHLAVEGFYGAAIAAYSNAARTPKNEQFPWDAQLAALAQQKINALKKINLHFLFSTFAYSDSNPFALPSGSGLPDGTTNYANYMSASIVAGFDKVANSMPRLRYGAFLNASQNFSFAGDGRQALNARTLGASAQARYGLPGIGRFGPRYDYSGASSPVELLTSAIPNSYETRTIGESHTLSLDFSRRLGAHWEGLWTYSYAFEQFTTPEDNDIFDRSGSRQSLSWISIFSTGSKFFQPAWSLYLEKKQALGSAENNLAYGSTLQNVARFGKTASFELQSNFSYESRAYNNFPGGRVDASSRFALTLVQYISQRLAVIGNSAYSTVSSNVDYYNQSRWLFSLGMRYGVLSFDSETRECSREYDASARLREADLSPQHKQDQMPSNIEVQTGSVLHAV